MQPRQLFSVGGAEAVDGGDALLNGGLDRSGLVNQPPNHGRQHERECRHRDTRGRQIPCLANGTSNVVLHQRDAVVEFHEIPLQLEHDVVSPPPR